MLRHSWYLYANDRYGVGYHMVVTKEAKCDTSAVIQIVTSTIPGAEMVNVVCMYLYSVNLTIQIS